MRLLSTLATSFALTSVVHSLTSDLTPVDAFVSTSTDVAMYVYVPETKTDNPAIVVAIHSCERDAQYYFDNTGYAALADEYGYIVIYPNSSAPSGCWDVCLS
jgi:acetylxylan esterase